MGDDRLIAADHQAITTVETPDAARGADIDIVDAFLAQGLGTADVVLVEAVAAVDDDIACAHESGDVGQNLFGDRSGGQHQPDDARRRKLRQ